MRLPGATIRHDVEARRVGVWRARHRTTCGLCGGELTPGQWQVWGVSSRRAAHLDCAVEHEIARVP